MVILEDMDCGKKTVEDKSFYIEKDIFLKARDYFHEHPDDRDKIIRLALSDGTALRFGQGFQKNMEELPPDLAVKVHLYVSDNCAPP